MSERITGTCKWFDTAKGYGFLTPDNEPELDVFCHYRSIQVDGFKNLNEGQRVSFLQVKGAKGFQAAEVEIESSTPDGNHNQGGNHV